MKKSTALILATVLVIGLLILCCCLVIFLFPPTSTTTPQVVLPTQNIGQQGTQQSEIQPQPTQFIAPTLETTRSPKEFLDAIAAKQFGDRLRTTDLSLLEGKNTATIEYNLGTVWDEASGVRSVTRDFLDVAPLIFQYTNAEIFIQHVFGEFTDVYGKELEEVAFQFTISRTLSGKIDWNNFDRQNLAIILTSDTDSSVYVHPAFRPAWIEDQNM